MRRQWFITISLLFAFSFLSLDVTSSQSQPGQSGKINGKITDPADYPILDAQVTVRNETKGETRNVKTDKEGRFKIEALASGRYVVSVTSPGFKPAKRNITIEGERTETVEIKLDIGEVSGPVVIQSHAQELSLKITIVAAQNSVKAGDPIEITVTMKNMSDHDITMVAVGSNSKAELNYEIIARDKNGEMLNETIYGKGLKGGVAGSRKLFTLKPGAEITETSDINKLYDMSMPGEYVIQVEKELPASEGKGMIKSNTITVTVTP